MGKHPHVEELIAWQRFTDKVAIFTRQYEQTLKDYYKGKFKYRNTHIKHENCTYNKKWGSIHMLRS